MNDQTKIQLSTLEMDLLNNSEWILTKNRIITKAQELLGEVQQNLSDFTNSQPVIFPPDVLKVSPKISKGENYLGLPWLILDYPRYFDKENILAIRTMFWWGHYFSTTLHLSGKYKLRYEDLIVNAYSELSNTGIYTCINSDQWHHHYEKENYVPVKEFSEKDFAVHVQERSFIKLSQKLPFSAWDSAPGLLTENFIRITGWLNQFPKR